ncbi:MAG: hypothetical protein CVV52_03230 [Spirochaetae bacterium HGW-Spirochaetae-8]|nr:MAG: hypothetical protein CVV52_03230 [Spirochaetae bacterium HGW-Spirochaetae-8]
MDKIIATSPTDPPYERPSVTRMLDMAETIVVRDGWKALSVRSLGKELGLSGPALYKHFHNMDELVDRVVQRIFARFMEYIVQYKIRTREAFTPDSPFSQWAEVIADGEAYLSFWAENPQWFDAFQSRALEHDLLAFDPTIPADIVETDVHAALEHSPAQAMPPLCAAQAVAWYLSTTWFALASSIRAEQHRGAPIAWDRYHAAIAASCTSWNPRNPHLSP